MTDCAEHQQKPAAAGCHEEHTPAPSACHGPEAAEDSCCATPPRRDYFFWACLLVVGLAYPAGAWLQHDHELAGPR